MRTKHLLNFQWKRSVSHSRPYITRVDLSRVLHRNPLNLNHRVSTARVAQYRGGCIKFDECLPREAPETSAFSHFLSLSRARVLSFLFLSPAKRRGESRKTGRSDLDKKKRKKKKEKKWRRWLRGRRRSKYVLSAFNDYFILTGEFISGLHYRAWPAPRRRILRTFSPFFFFLSRRGGEISVPRTEGKGRRSITCGLTEHSAPLSAKGRIGRLLFPILFQNTLQRTSEPPPLPRVASIARLPRSFLNKFPSETRSSLPFGYRWNRDASDVACPGENCGIPYQYRNGDTRKYKMEKELNGVTFKRCYWISLQRNKDSLAR